MKNGDDGAAHAPGTDTLFSEISCSGVFWLPGSAERVGGHLTFNQADGVRLQVFEPLVKQVFLGPTRPNRLDSVLGRTTEGTPYTLCDVMWHGARWTDEGVVAQRFVAKYLVRGAHLPSLGSLGVLSCSVSYSHFPEWIHHQPFDVDLEAKVIRYGGRSCFEADIAALGARLTLATGPVLNETLFRSTSIHPAPRIDIKASTPQLWPWYETTVFELQGLFMLLASTNVQPEVVVVASEHGEGQIFFRMSAASPATLRHPMEMLLTLPAISPHLANVLESWFAKDAKLGPVFGLYSRGFRGVPAFLQVSFLEVVQGLESFHRSTRRGSYLEDGDYERIKEGLVPHLPADIDKDLRESLVSRIKYGNQYSLRKRLTALFSEVPDGLRWKLTKDAKAEKILIGKSVSTRNYFTHLDDDLRPEALRGEELAVATQRLRCLFLILLLRHLRVPDELIENAVAYSSDFSSLLGYP